jgi:hypothetical protein
VPLVRVGWICTSSGGKEIHKEFWWDDHMESGHLKDREGDGQILLRWMEMTYGILC